MRRHNIQIKEVKICVICGLSYGAVLPGTPETSILSGMSNIKGKENIKFYDLNRDAINEGHIGEYVVIQNGTVVGYAKDMEGGFDVLGESAEPGSFIIHQCLPDEEDFVDIGCHIPTAAFEVDWR